MPSQRRKVARSVYFVETAESFFPPGGSPSGRPSFEQFADGPLRAMEELCAYSFESMAEAWPGIRAWTTIELPFFPPMTFYAVLDTVDVVELVDLVVDTDYDWGVNNDGER